MCQNDRWDRIYNYNQNTGGKAPDYKETKAFNGIFKAVLYIPLMECCHPAPRLTNCHVKLCSVVDHESSGFLCRKRFRIQLSANATFNQKIINIINGSNN